MRGLFRTAHHCFRAYGGGGSQIKANSIFYTSARRTFSSQFFVGPTGGFVTWVSYHQPLTNIHMFFFPAADGLKVLDETCQSV